MRLTFTVMLSPPSLLALNLLIYFDLFESLSGPLLIVIPVFKFALQSEKTKVLLLYLYDKHQLLVKYITNIMFQLHSSVNIQVHN